MLYPCMRAYLPAEIRGDDAGVEAVGCDAAAAQAPAQLTAEQDVGQLGLDGKKYQIGAGFLLKSVCIT